MLANLPVFSFLKTLFLEKRKRLIIALLFITLFFLGRYIFQQAGDGTNKDSFLKTSTGLYQVVAEVPLGQVEVYNYQRMGFTKGFVCFSPDGAALAVGTENSELLVLESEMGKLKWRKRSGNGKISALAFSRDGRRLYVGENGPQADLICLDAQTGEELWRRGSAKELGSGLNDKTYPGIVCIREYLGYIERPRRFPHRFHRRVAHHFLPNEPTLLLLLKFPLVPRN